MSGNMEFLSRAVRVEMRFRLQPAVPTEAAIAAAVFPWASNATAMRKYALAKRGWPATEPPDCVVAALSEPIFGRNFSEGAVWRGVVKLAPKRIDTSSALMRSASRFSHLHDSASRMTVGWALAFSACGRRDA